MRHATVILGTVLVFGGALFLTDFVLARVLEATAGPSAAGLVWVRYVGAPLAGAIAASVWVWAIGRRDARR